MGPYHVGYGPVYWGYYGGGWGYHPWYYAYPVYAPGVVTPRSAPASTPVPTAPTFDSGLRLEFLDRNTLRLTWPGDGRAVDEVNFFLTDANDRVLDAARVVAYPFTATFKVPAGAAFAGVTIVYSDGVKTTTTVPFPAKN